MPAPHRTPTRHRVTALLGTVLVLLSASGCSGPPPATTAPPSSAAGHGAITGAEEVAEPPLMLLSVDERGEVGLVDLLDGAASAVGRIGAPRALASDGRYAFVTTDAGIEVVDSGAWTWDHVDHFHYYRAAPAILGTVRGDGPAVLATGPLATAGSTGIFFEGSGEAVLLDNEALSKGSVEESFRLRTGAARGIVAPWGEGAVIAVDGVLRYHDRSGTPSGAEVDCADPAGSITTRAGLAIGCADGAVLVTGDGEPVFERIPVVDGGSRPLGFDGRKGRPTVAGVTGGDGFLLLDTRERAWSRVATGQALVRAVAVDDEAGHVVALDGEGRIRVYADGAEIAATAPVVVGDPGVASLWLDAQRAYIGSPAEGVVREIDYADGARIARTIETPTRPVFFAEVGR
ncbi:ABC transporter [Microbacterium sp. MYb64]|uniref:ABC transporter n=1 Tax=Microbacterium sp. MYb64 TaxID=1848691 RepID=UPI000CFDC214|nr:ABC transporter [Microbacterium sp. MYb64]PRB00529.1 ABC transporter [Microbacterium sp. MYb64]